jgi:HAAS domain-containing protein
MDKLEQYVEQVCRHIGGPRAMRQHVRQELREHLRDAVAQHRAAGLSEEESLARALEEFGKPEDVRSELEATHGHQMMAVVIDKAIEWKEMTMRAKWLWTTWAYLGLAVTIALEVLFITFMVLMIIPKYQKLLRDGMIDYDALVEHEVAWMAAFLNGLQEVAGGYTTFLVLGAAVLWGLFEWRVKSENKSLMRLSALGTVAAILMVVIMLAAGSMVVSFTLAMPAMGQLSRPYALERVSAIDASISALESALANNDWKATHEQADQASYALRKLAQGPVLHSLSRTSEPQSLDELRDHVQAARESVAQVNESIAEKDGAQLKASLAEFRKAFEPVRQSARELKK